MKPHSRLHPNRNISGLQPTVAPDKPGNRNTVATTVRVRLDQKAWLDSQGESASTLVRIALDRFIENQG